MIKVRKLMSTTSVGRSLLRVDLEPLAPLVDDDVRAVRALRVAHLQDGRRTPA